MKNRQDVIRLFLTIASVCFLYGKAPAASSLAVIDEAEFDTVTHLVSLSWHLDTADIPAGCEGAFIALTGNATPELPPDHPFPITALSGDTIFNIDPLLSDTLYRIGLLLRIQGIWKIPEESSLKEVAIPPLTWEAIRLFSVSVKDTIHLFENRVLLWRDNTYPASTPQHRDTLNRYTIPKTRLKGFRPNILGFRFSSPVPLPEFYIGFRTDSASAIRYTIFRDSSDLLLSEHEARFDTTRQLVFVKTNRIDLPFLLLADTLRPKVTITSDTGSALSSTPYEFSFTITDNTANTAWKVFSGPGDAAVFAGAPTSSGLLHDIAVKQTCKFSTTGAMDEGLRVYLVTDDGTGTDTMNFSRSVARTRCDETTLPAGMIMPIMTTSKLDSTSCRFALRTLFTRAGNRYRSSEFRIYKWAPSASSLKSGWMEYSGSTAKKFTLNPGSLSWCITRREATIDFGKGGSPSLTDTVTVTLPPGEWTDFSSPFGFPVPFTNICSATGASAQKLHFHQWIKDEPKRTWNAQPLYSGDVPGMDSGAISLPYGSGGYFTVYNPSDTVIRLRLPPVASPPGMAKKIIHPGRQSDWSVRFKLKQGRTVLGQVLCGVSSRIQTPVTIPPAPAFTETDLTLGLPDADRSYGTIVLPDYLSGAAAITVTITNSSSRTVNYQVEPTTLVGTAEGTLVFETEDRSIEEPFSLHLSPHETRTVLCKIGLKPKRQSELSRTEPAEIFILPATGLLRGNASPAIRYIAPAGQHRLELFDVQGHRISPSGIQRIAGTSEYRAFFSNSTFSSGCYVARLTIERFDGVKEEIRSKLLVP